MSYIKIAKENSLLHNFISALLRSLIDYYKKGFSYHSGAISFYSLMFFVPLIVVITVSLSFVVNINISSISTVLEHFFPKSTSDFIKIMLVLSSQRTTFGLVGFIAAFYFSTSIVSALHKAILFTFDVSSVSTKKTVIISFMGIPLLMLSLIVLYILTTIISSFQSIISPHIATTINDMLRYLRILAPLSLILNIQNLIHILVLFTMVFVIYLFFIPKEEKSLKYIIVVSTFISILMFILKIIFTGYIIFVSKRNPIYGSLSGIFVFLIWLHLNFDSILIGSRMLFYLRNSNFTIKGQNA